MTSPYVAIVEDDDSVRVALGRLCRAYGMSTRELATAHELVASLTERRPDCVVLDLNGSLTDGQTESCDLETGAGCASPLPAPIKYHDANGNNAWDNGEDIVLDVNNDGICD